MVAVMVVLSLQAVHRSWGHKWKPLPPMKMPTWPTWRSVSRWYLAEVVMPAAKPARPPLKLKRRPLQPLLPAVSVAVVAGVERGAAVERVEAKVAAQQALEATLMTLQHKPKRLQNTQGSTSMLTTSRRAGSLMASLCQRSHRSLMV